jgi:hypothetical protein
MTKHHFCSFTQSVAIDRQSAGAESGGRGIGYTVNFDE